MFRASGVKVSYDITVKAHPEMGTELTINEQYKRLYRAKRLAENKALKKIKLNDQLIIDDPWLVQVITKVIATYTQDLEEPPQAITPRGMLYYSLPEIIALESAGVKRSTICDFLHACGLETTSDAIRKAIKRTKSPLK